MSENTQPWSDPHPEIPYLPKPALKPADWLVEQDPVNPNATPEARALLQYLYSLSGKHTLTGRHNYIGRRHFSTELAIRQSGKTPALYGSDWGFAAVGDKDTAYERDELVQELTRQWQGGAVVTLCWHAVRPTHDEPVTFSGNVRGQLTDAEFEDVLTPGTALYDRWCAQVDAIAVHLLQLQEAHIPVLWRPYHEINGDWFWWGGRRGDEDHGTKQLYRQIYDRLVNLHGLNNLLWVWNPDRPSRADRQFVDYFPGIEYVDVLALDCYGAFEQSYYDDLNALSGGKVLAIGETHTPPAIPSYDTQPKWAYFMIWASDSPGDSNWPVKHDWPELRALVRHPRILSLDDPMYREGIARVQASAQE